MRDEIKCAVVSRVLVLWRLSLSFGSGVVFSRGVFFLPIYTLLLLFFTSTLGPTCTLDASPVNSHWGDL